MHAGALPLKIVLAALLAASVAGGCGSPRTKAPVRHSAPVISSADMLRTMKVDGRTKACVDTTNWQSELKYVAVMDLPMHCIMIPGRMLLFGLGGGSIARNYRRMSWNVDVVEPDTARLAIAKTSFGFNDPGVRVLNVTGRAYLADTTRRYDIILLDCIGSDDYPEEMMTKEFFALAASRLPAAGIFAIAVESVGWKDEMVRSLAATLGAAFRQVIVLPIAEPPNMFGSIVLMASNTPRNDLLRDPERNLDYSPEWRYGPEYQKAHAWDNHFSILPAGARVQTDEENSWATILATIRAEAAKQPKEYLP
jgi:spermidine synthase